MEELSLVSNQARDSGECFTTTIKVMQHSSAFLHYCRKPEQKIVKPTIKESYEKIRLKDGP